MRALVPFLLLLVACGGGGDALPPQEAAAAFETEQPEIVLLTVSGRNLDLLNLLCPPECNEAYLGTPGRSGEALLTALLDAGYTLETRHYIAALFSYDDDGDNQPDRLGCLKLIEDLRWIKANWVDGSANPTRVVLVGHSHGCVWAHNVAAALPEVDIDVLVSLDGVSTQWEGDHQPSINDYYGAEGRNPFPIDIRDVTEVWNGRDTKDVAFDNIAVNIEVRSNNDCVLCLYDPEDNERVDGSFAGIFSFLSGDEDHSEVTNTGGPGMNFVIDRVLTTLALP